MKTPENLMTPEEVADLLRVARRTIITMARDRRIPHVRLGRLYRFDAGEVSRWVEQNHYSA